MEREIKVLEEEEKKTNEFLLEKVISHFVLLQIRL